MSTNILVLLPLTLSIALFHTLSGPDHYIPFIALAKARSWSVSKTFLVTLSCGIGHILSSVLIGLVGIGIGITVGRMQWIETWRGEIASWMLIAFGFAYFIWGMKQVIRNKPHIHPHVHSDGSLHLHDHTHQSEHVHIHEAKSKLAPWFLFIIFIFGPCEPLIPLVMVPAAQGSLFNVLIVSLSFGLVTVATMLAMVFASLYGMKVLSFKPLERYGHALAGAIIGLSGVGIKVFGL